MMKPIQTKETPIHNVPEDALGEEVFVEDQNMYTAEELEELETETPDNCDEEDLEYHMMSHADFLNRLCNEKFIPRKSVTEVAEEFYENCLKSNKLKEKKPRNFR